MKRIILLLTVLISTIINAQTIEAESYSASAGVWKESSTDGLNAMNVGGMDANDWVEYTTAIKAGSYQLNIRVASTKAGTLRLTAGTFTQDIAIINTGGWQVWQTVIINITLPDVTKIRFTSVTGGININWFSLTSLSEPIIQSQQTQPTQSLITEERLKQVIDSLSEQLIPIVQKQGADVNVDTLPPNGVFEIVLESDKGFSIYKIAVKSKIISVIYLFGLNSLSFVDDKVIYKGAGTYNYSREQKLFYK